MSGNIKNSAQQILRNHFGSSLEVTALESLSGGCINDAARLDTTEGEFFFKWSRDPRAYQQFRTEKLALEAMRTSETRLQIPEPITAEASQEGVPAFLLTEFIESGPKNEDFDENLGEGLAELHDYSADQFGFEEDTFCGETLQPNLWTDNWLDFYRDYRLGFQLKLMEGNRSLAEGEKATVQTLLDNLDEYLPTSSDGPSLIHGDLWSGNVMANRDGDPVIIDPAAYFADREAEFGMMFLFGGFSEDVYRAYESASPLRDNWRETVELYSLYHVLNHFNIFGGHYKRQALEMVRSWVS
jgi:fructosamine-3-kinase